MFTYSKLHSSTNDNDSKVVPMFAQGVNVVRVAA